MVVFIRELTLALFDNTFVTHMDDFSIRQIHNILINSYLQKRVHKRGISDKIYLGSSQILVQSPIFYMKEQYF